MKRVVVFSEGFLPGFKAGGPVASLSRLIEVNPTIEFLVVSRDRDVGDNTPYSEAHRCSWVTVGHASVLYVAPRLSDWWYVMKSLRFSKQTNAYYLNSLHNPLFTLLPLLLLKFRILPRRPVHLAPRGETAVAALRMRRLKKQLAKPWIRWLIGADVTWHVSSAMEVDQVANWWNSGLPDSHKVVIQPDRAISPIARASAGLYKWAPTVVFASRIDPMKGLDDAIRILAGVSSRFSFHIHGVVSDPDYWEYCKNLANEILDPSCWQYEGPYGPREAQSIFSKAALFLLPTRGENFGHAIAESLSVGCPVVVPATTLWTSVIDDGAGHVIRDWELTKTYISDALRASESERTRSRERALSLYSKWFEAQEKNVTSFAEIIDQSS